LNTFPQEYKNIRIEAIANYKGDNIYGAPGLRIYVERENLHYKEQLKAQKEYKKKMDKFCNDWFEWETSQHRYEKEREKAIQDKIKEMEESGEI
jgi:hypothetical protein